MRFGPGGAPNIAIPIANDFDDDSDIDIIFAFRPSEAGIACEDTELGLTGSTYDGIPVVSSDSITTTDCTVGSCHP